MSDKQPSPPSFQVTPTVDMNSMMDAIQKVSKDKSSMDVLLELLKESNLEFITEFPNVNYTKMATKLMTWRTSTKEVFHLDEDGEDTIVKDMLHEFMLKMTSHRRRRSQEIASVLQQVIGQPLYNAENKVKRSFFGLR